MKSNVKSGQETIKVVIADDQSTIRKSLQLQLSEVNDIEVVALAIDGVDALEKIAKLDPDIIIIDLEMPNMDGVTAIKEICVSFSQTKALVFSTHDEREYINRAILAGAKGYLLKGTPTQDLIDAIRNVHQGYFQLGLGLLDKVSSISQASLSSDDELSHSTINLEELSNLESKITRKVNNLIELKTSDNYNRSNELLQARLQLVVTEQTKIYAQFKKIELKFYLLLCWQIILTVIILLNI